MDLRFEKHRKRYKSDKIQFLRKSENKIQNSAGIESRKKKKKIYIIAIPLIV